MVNILDGNITQLLINVSSQSGNVKDVIEHNMAGVEMPHNFPSIKCTQTKTDVKVRLPWWIENAAIS